MESGTEHVYVTEPPENAKGRGSKSFQGGEHIYTGRVLHPNTTGTVSYTEDPLRPRPSISSSVWPSVSYTTPFNN